MKKFISFHLAFILFLSTVLPAFGQIEKCQNGECADRMIDELQDLGSIYQKECLPSEGVKSEDLQGYYEENGLTEQCWKLITRINHLESKIKELETVLEERLGCEGGDCRLSHKEAGANTELLALTKVEQNLSCTEPKKELIKKECPKDMACVLSSTALGIGGYAAEVMFPEKSKIKNCHLGDDSCMTQLATGFLKATIGYFESSWDLLKMAGAKAGKEMKDFWTWVSGAENHSSTAQLALAKASEDPGVFDMLLKDFPGTMSKIWSAFVGSIKEWLKNDIFCEKWSGVPHFSTCQKPNESFECIPCKTMVSGLCAVTGTILSQVVPSFITGGLVTAAKYGANGAIKIAKTFKISSKVIKAIKSSRIAKVAFQQSKKIDEVLKVSQGLRTAKAVSTASLRVIRNYLLSPARNVLKDSYMALSQSLKKGTAYIAHTKFGKIMVFNQKLAKHAGTILIYPIHNPMRIMAYEAGQRSFEKLVKLGLPKLAVKGPVTASLMKKSKYLASLLLKIEEAKFKKGRAKNILALEEKLLASVSSQRKEFFQEVVKREKVDFDEVVNRLYPELQYGELAVKVGATKVLKAEKELLEGIASMPEGSLKATLMTRYHSHVRPGQARAKIVGDTTARE